MSKALWDIFFCLFFFPQSHGMMLDLLLKSGLFLKPSMSYVFLVFWSLTEDPTAWVETILCSEKSNQVTWNVPIVCEVLCNQNLQSEICIQN